MPQLICCLQQFRYKFLHIIMEESVTCKAMSQISHLTVYCPYTQIIRYIPTHWALEMYATLTYKFRYMTTCEQFRSSMAKRQKCFSGMWLYFYLFALEMRLLDFIVTKWEKEK